MFYLVCWGFVFEMQYIQCQASPVQLCGSEFSAMAAKLRTWAPNIAHKDGLKEMILFMDNVAGTLDNKVRRSQRELAEEAIRSALCSLRVKGQKKHEKDV